MLSIGHRGMPRKFTENTIESFRLAVSAQIDRIELDVRLTTEGRLVVFHDKTLKRLSSGDVREVQKIPFKELSKISLKTGGQIPLLSQVLEEINPYLEINIELKSKNLKIAKELVKLLAENPPKKRIILSSFYEFHLQFLLKELGPHGSIAYLCSQTDLKSFVLSQVEKNSYPIVHPEASMLTKDFVKNLRTLGVEIFPWVRLALEEDETLWRKMLDLKVDGLCSNQPDKFKKFLKKEGVVV